MPLISTDLASAELIKYAANAFLAPKISYINEIGQLAEKVGADITQVAKGIGLDARIGTRFLQAGIGWGGSCFGKDTAALVATAREYNLAMPIVEAAREINRRQRERVVEKLLAELKILKGRTIGLLGLAFKPNTDDLREAPAIDIARKLIERGCKVKAHDPVALDRFEREYRGFAGGVLRIARRSGRRSGRAGAGDRVAGVPRAGLGSDGQPHAVAPAAGRPSCTGQGALRAHRIPLSGNRELASRDYFTAMVTPAWLLAVPTVIRTGTFPLFRPVGTVAFTCNRPAGSSGAAPA